MVNTKTLIIANQVGMASQLIEKWPIFLGIGIVILLVMIIVIGIKFAYCRHPLLTCAIVLPSIS